MNKKYFFYYSIFSNIKLLIRLKKKIIKKSEINLVLVFYNINVTNKFTNI